jgi:hypothetical protein
MITINYHPLVNAVVNTWRMTLPHDRAGLPLSITHDDLSDLIGRLATTIDVLVRSYDAGGRVASTLFERGITQKPLNTAESCSNDELTPEQRANRVPWPKGRLVQQRPFEKFTNKDVADLICRADACLSSPDGSKPS